MQTQCFYEFAPAGCGLGLNESKISEVKFTKSGKLWPAKLSELFIPFSQYREITTKSFTCALDGFLIKSGWRFGCVPIIWPVFGLISEELQCVTSANLDTGFLMPNSNNLLNLQHAFYQLLLTAGNNRIRLCEMLPFSGECCYPCNLPAAECQVIAAGVLGVCLASRRTRVRWVRVSVGHVLLVAAWLVTYWCCELGSLLVFRLNAFSLGCRNSWSVLLVVVGRDKTWVRVSWMQDFCNWFHFEASNFSSGFWSYLLIHSSLFLAPQSMHISLYFWFFPPTLEWQVQVKLE